NAGRIFNGSADGLRTLVLPAPLAAVAWNAPAHRLTETQATALLGGSYPSAVVMTDPSLKTPFTHQLSAGVDHVIGADLALSASILYARGFNFPGSIDYNPLLPATLGAGRRPNDLPCAAKPSATCVNGGIPGTSATVLQFTGFGETWYKGLT